MKSIMACALALTACASSEPSDLAGETSALTVAGGNAAWFNSSTYVDAAVLKLVVLGLRDTNANMQAMASTSGGGWIVVSDDEVWWGGPISSSVYSAARVVHDLGQTVRAIDINAENGWIVVGDSVVYSGGALPAGVVNTVNNYIANGWTIRDVDITLADYVVLGEGSLATYSAGVDADLKDFLFDRRAARRLVEQVDIGFDGRWVAVADQEPAWENVTTQLQGVLTGAAQSERHVSRLMLGPGAGFVVYSHGLVTPSAGNVMEAIEYNLSGSNIWQKLQAAGVPGLSIAIIDNNQVVFARGYGRLRSDEDAHVLATTPFDLASLSKYLGALVMARLGGQGLVNFTADILAAPGANIDAWRDNGTANPATYGIPNNVALAAGVTVQQLMRHSAGMRVIASPDYPEDSWAFVPLMAPWMHLLGVDCDAGPSCGWQANYVWRDPAVPFGTPRYSTGNFMIVEAIATDASGKTGTELLNEYFFGPMNLDDIASGVPAASFMDRSAWHHLNNTPSAVRYVWPWTFGGGVRASARDYAEMMIIALNGGKDSSGVQRVTSSRLADMLTGANGAGYGLFFEGGSTAAEGTDRSFVHNGRHSEGAYTRMCGNPTRNEGIVILANTQLGGNVVEGLDPALFNDILDAYVAAMGWPAGLNCR